QGKLRRKLADALVHAGRGGEAAEAYLLAAAQSPAADALGLRRSAAAQLLFSGRLDEGQALLAEGSETIGLRVPPTTRRALVWLPVRPALIRMRGLGFRVRDASSMPPSDLARLDLAYSMTASFAQTDVIRGAEMQARHLLLALRAGEPVR